MIAITVSRLARAPGSYEVSGPVGIGGRQYTAECRGAGDAAAKALQYAKNNISGEYVIIGAKEVMDHIPESLRTGKS